MLFCAYLETNALSRKSYLEIEARKQAMFSHIEEFEERSEILYTQCIHKLNYGSRLPKGKRRKSIPSMPCVEGHSNCVFNEQFLTANVTILWIFTQNYAEKSLFCNAFFVVCKFDEL